MSVYKKSIRKPQPTPQHEPGATSTLRAPAYASCTCPKALWHQINLISTRQRKCLSAASRGKMAKPDDERTSNPSTVYCVKKRRQESFWDVVITLRSDMSSLRFNETRQPIPTDIRPLRPSGSITGHRSVCIQKVRYRGQYPACATSAAQHPS
jgi:hypothetical protein